MFLKIFLSLVVEKSLKDVIFREIISMKNVTITITKYELAKMFTIIILTFEKQEGNNNLNIKFVK